MIRKKTMQSFPKQGAIYWFDPEPVKGAELRTIRQCVVISPDEMNEHLRMVIIAPLTSTIQLWPFRLTVQTLGQASSIACDELRAIDKSRLRAYIGDIRPEDKLRLLSVLHTMFAE